MILLASWELPQYCCNFKNSHENPFIRRNVAGFHSSPEFELCVLVGVWALLGLVLEHLTLHTESARFLRVWGFWKGNPNLGWFQRLNSSLKSSITPYFSSHFWGIDRAIEGLARNYSLAACGGLPGWPEGAVRYRPRPGSSSRSQGSKTPTKIVKSTSRPVSPNHETLNQSFV